MRKDKPKLTLSCPISYQIKVPGHLDERWIEWVGRMTFSVESDGSAITTLTGIVDQAALHGLLRQLYTLGLPLISVNCVEGDSEDEE